MLTLIICAVFISVALLTTGLLYPVLNRRFSVRNRVDRLISPREARHELVPTPPKWQTVLADMGSRLRMKPADLFKYREMVTKGGFKDDNVWVFLGGKLLLAAVLPTAYLVLYTLPRGTLFSSTSLLVAIILAICGFLLPTWWLHRRGENRKTEIFHSLPDVLDLLTVCVEAGVSLDAAMIKTVENFQHRKNPLIEEINRVTLEVRAGRTRSEALKGLVERTMVDDVRSFVAMLLQTEKFGTSLGKTLRTYSDSQRMKRKQYAEEQAAKTATKMLIPLVLFIFPGLMVVILTPAFIKIMVMFEKG